MTDKVSLALSAIAVATGILTYLQGRKPGGKHRKVSANGTPRVS